MAKKQEKTNVCRVLDQKGLNYNEYTYDPENGMSGVEVANSLGQDPDKVFKTLVTVGASKKNYVFMIPVAAELNLKKAAKAACEKSIEMIKSKELLPLTGYIHGGCSPIGMKKLFPTYIDETVLLCDTICFSGGKIGYQVEMKFEDLQKVVPVVTADVTD